MDDFSFLEVIWTIFVIYGLLLLIMMLFAVVSDLFRDHELSGGAKAAWIIVLLLVPIAGILLYVIVRHKGMMERASARHEAAKKAFESRVQDVAGSGGAAQEIAAAKGLLDAGAISQEEFEAMKAKALG